MKPSRSYSPIAQAIGAMAVPAILLVWWALGRFPFTWPGSMIALAAGALPTAARALLLARLERLGGDAYARKQLAGESVGFQPVLPATSIALFGLSVGLMAIAFRYDRFAALWWQIGLVTGQFAGYPHWRAQARRLQQVTADREKRLAALAGPPSGSPQA